MKPFNLSLSCDSVWDSVGSFIGCELCSSTRSMWGIPRQAGTSAEVAYPHLAKALLGFPRPQVLNLSFPAGPLLHAKDTG